MQGNGSVIIYISGKEDLELENVEFSFESGDKTLTTGADNSGGITGRAGTLALKLEPFSLWQSAHTIVLSQSNERDMHRAFEVSRQFRNPIAENGWLVFRVMPKPTIPK